MEKRIEELEGKIVELTATIRNMSMEIDKNFSIIAEEIRKLSDLSYNTLKTTNEVKEGVEEVKAEIGKIQQISNYTAQYDNMQIVKIGSVK